ncbi:MAG: hypothetical protein ACE5GC_02145 [Acidimicrobiia bacterium]
MINHLIKTFPDAASISGADATASIPIVSQTPAVEWVMPSVERLRSATRADLSIPNWIGEAGLADPEHFLDLKLTAAAHFIEGQNPDVERLGPEYYVEKAASCDVPLVLDVVTAFLALAEPRAVCERVKHYVQAGMMHDRFALYLCNLGATTPQADVLAAVDAAHTFGAY